MTKQLKPSQLNIVLPLPANAAEWTVACEMGLISGYFKKRQSLVTKEEQHLHEQPPQVQEEKEATPHWNNHHDWSNNQLDNINIFSNKAIFPSFKG